MTQLYHLATYITMDLLPENVVFQIASNISRLNDFALVNKFIRKVGKRVQKIRHDHFTDTYNEIKRIHDRMDDIMHELHLTKLRDPMKDEYHPYHGELKDLQNRLIACIDQAPDKMFGFQRMIYTSFAPDFIIPEVAVVMTRKSPQSVSLLMISYRQKSLFKVSFYDGILNDDLIVKRMQDACVYHKVMNHIFDHLAWMMIRPWNFEKINKIMVILDKQDKYVVQPLFKQYMLNEWMDGDFDPVWRNTEMIKLYESDSYSTPKLIISALWLASPRACRPQSWREISIRCNLS